MIKAKDRGEAIENIRCLLMLNTVAIPDDVVMQIHDRLHKFCEDFNKDFHSRMEKIAPK